MTTAIRKSTPVLFVDAIEPSVAFWERLGFAVTMSVPHGDQLGFAILVRDDVELMYQSAASIAGDMPALAPHARDRSFLFVEVDDVDAIATALAGHEIFQPRRQTFYGSTEIGYREPGGHFVTFAMFAR